MLLDKIVVEKKRRRRENAGVKKDIEQWIEKNLPKDTYVYYKNWGGGFNRAGRPDIEITYKGKVNYWELKDEQGFLSTLQKEVIKSYARAGKTVYVAETLDQFLNIWNKIYEDEY